jgi:hypothetical protein
MVIKYDYQAFLTNKHDLGKTNLYFNAPSLENYSKDGFYFYEPLFSILFEK